MGWRSLDGTSRKYFPVASGSVPGIFGLGPTGGWLLYNLDGRVFAQRFDYERGELQGDAVSLVDGLGGGPKISASRTGTLAFRRSSITEQQLVWVSRDGRALGMVAEPGPIHNPRLSPDGRVVAYSLGPDIWLHDLARSASTRLTFDDGARPVWTPDGKNLIYDNLRDERTTQVVAMRAASGLGAETRVLERSGRLALAILNLSPDGEWAMVFDTPNIYFRSRTGEKKVPLVEADRANGGGGISPDGRWVLYLATTREGVQEVRVQPMPAEAGGRVGGGGKFQIGAGTQPRWRRDGKEIFYIAPGGRMMAVPVDSGPDYFRPGAPRPLFEVNFDPQGSQAEYDVTRDGQRFLIAQPVAGNDTPITVIMNWPRLLQ